MKKRWIPFILSLVLMVSACSGEPTEKENNATSKENTSETVTYESENGPVDVPADPQRVVVLSHVFSGHVMALDVNLVGVDKWSKMNPRFKEELKDIEEVSDENLEKIIELEPDLIIGLSTIKNVDKLSQIAPTVTYTHGKVDYLTQHLEIGKLLNKEKEAKEWIEDFKKRAQAAGEDIRAKIGEDATVSVIGSYDKEIYVYGNNFGRGTEILYQAMDLKMPEKVKEVALKPGYYAISAEVLPEYAGDYLVLSKSPGVDHSFQETDTYKNIPAVKNNRVFELNDEETSFNDPLTLEYLLDFFIKSFLGN